MARPRPIPTETPADLRQALVPNQALAAGGELMARSAQTQANLAATQAQYWGFAAERQSRAISDERDRRNAMMRDSLKMLNEMSYNMMGMTKDYIQARLALLQYNQAQRMAAAQEAFESRTAAELAKPSFESGKGEGRDNNAP